MERSRTFKDGPVARTISSESDTSVPLNDGPLVDRARAVEQAMAALLDSVRACAIKTEEDFAGIRLLSREHAAELLDLSLSQLDRLTKKGAIPTVWIDRRPRYPLSQIREWLAARTTAPGTGASGSITANKKMMNISWSKKPERRHS